MRSLVSHWLLSVDGHSIQAPLAFSVYQDLITHQPDNNQLFRIESLRKKLQSEKTLLTIDDLGAGSRYNPEKKRTVESIAKHGISDRKYSEVLYKLILRQSSDTMIELGTSIGINTLYMALGNPNGSVYTFEGSQSLIDISQRNFRELGLTNIQTIQGNIDTELPIALKNVDKIDFAYMDANHTYEATIRYFQLLLEKISEHTIIAIDDIYWSKDMTKAWQEIHTMAEVSLSYDLFDMGLVFFKKNIPKQHYRVSL